MITVLCVLLPPPAAGGRWNQMQKKINAIHKAVVVPYNNNNNNNNDFEEQVSPPEIKVDSTIPCDIKSLLTYPGQELSKPYGGFAIYKTGPFASRPSYLNFNDFFFCAYSYSSDDLRDFENMELYTAETSPDTCFGFQSTFKSTIGGSKTCPVQGKKTTSVKTALPPPDTVSGWSITGCFDNFVISSMIVNGKNCGTSTAGQGYSAYPTNQPPNKCKFEGVQGHQSSGTLGGQLSNLYFYWRC